MNQLKDLRLQAGLNQRDLAEKAGVSRRTIQRLEAGEGPASDLTLAALGRALKLRKGRWRHLLSEVATEDLPVCEACGRPLLKQPRARASR